MSNENAGADAENVMVNPVRNEETQNAQKSFEDDNDVGAVSRQPSHDQESLSTQGDVAGPSSRTHENVAKSSAETDVQTQSSDEEAIPIVSDERSSRSDARPESLTKLSDANKFLGNLTKLSEEDLAVYKYPTATSIDDRATTNGKIASALKFIFETALSNPTKLKEYDRFISSCFRKIFTLRSLDLPELWEDTIRTKTSKFVLDLTCKTIATEERDNTEITSNTVSRLKILLVGSGKSEDHRLSVHALELLQQILSVVLPENRELDDDYFLQLHVSAAFYHLIKTVIVSWISKKDFIEHERPRMTEELKGMVKKIEDKNYYLHDWCPLVQIELVQIILQLERLIEVVEQA